MYIGTEKLKNMSKISILDLKYTFEEQNMLFLVLAVLVYLVFRVNGGSLELLYSLFQSVKRSHFFRVPLRSRSFIKKRSGTPISLL